MVRKPLYEGGGDALAVAPAVAVVGDEGAVAFDVAGTDWNMGVRPACWVVITVRVDAMNTPRRGGAVVIASAA